MDWIAPMEPVSNTQVKEGPQFIHEIKWDGIRGLVYLQDNILKMFTKKGNERTEFYPELGYLREQLAGQSLVLDGEIVVTDNNGLPSFQNVLVRETVKNKRNLEFYLRNYPIKYIVFDILYNKGQLLTKQPLGRRKEILQEVITPVLEKSDFIFLSDIYYNGNELYEKMKEKNMEGIVSKKIDSPYIGGKKHEEWFKSKFTKKMLCVLGGIQWKENIPNSLLLGVKSSDSSKLIFMGKASLGLKGQDLILLKQYKDYLIQNECPFDISSLSDVDKAGTELTWSVPVLTCWISFLELSNDGHFRHPKIIGFTKLTADEADGKVLTE